MTGRLAEHEIARRENARHRQVTEITQSLADLETHSTRLTVDRKHLVVIPLITKDYVTTPGTRESAPVLHLLAVSTTGRRRNCTCTR